LTLPEDQVVSLLNQAKYLYLRHISEPEDNSLRLVVEEAIADRTETVSTPDPASPFAEIRKVGQSGLHESFSFVSPYSSVSKPRGGFPLINGKRIPYMGGSATCICFSVGG
jgi:hypothetical protein